MYFRIIILIKNNELGGYILLFILRELRKRLMFGGRYIRLYDIPTGLNR
jgi:hypothetical protein